MALFDEVGERLEDFGLDQNRLTRTSKLTPHGNQLELAEAIRGLVHDCTNALRGGHASPRRDRTDVARRFEMKGLCSAAGWRDHLPWAKDTTAVVALLHSPDCSQSR
jgi:hypothetical protein